MPSCFLDTSAWAKLYHEEAGTEFVERLVDSRESGTWLSRLSLVEIESVFAIKVRTGELDLDGLVLAQRRLRADLRQSRLRVGPPIVEAHYQVARELLVKFGVPHGLRTLDALQLAVALEWQRAALVSLLVSADQRMCRVAAECGLPSVDPANPSVVLSTPGS